MNRLSSDPRQIRDSLRNLLSLSTRTRPDRSEAYLRALIEQRGAVELSQLRAKIEPEIWERDLAYLKIADVWKSIQWTLGYGSFLGEFFASPLKPDPDEFYHAASIGARVNLIVSLYDSFLDQGIADCEILADDFSAGSRIQLVSLLVREYFRLIPKPDPLLLRAIQKMYFAEKQSRLPLTGHSALMMWRRKSALPFVVMALSLSSSGQPDCSRYSWLAWVYRTGCCLGWIDDASDIGKDHISGQFNRFNEGISVDFAANMVHRVMEWWDRHGDNADCRHVFLYCIHSWIAPRTS